MKSRSSDIKIMPQMIYSKRGYTLIEVLIGVAIFSAMVVLASMALSQGLGQYQRLKEKGINFWDHAKYLWLDKSLNSVVDYYVYSRGSGWAPYFKGNRDLISYVSLSPFAGEGPVVAWIRNERQEDGSRALVYYELPVYAKDLKELERAYTLGDFKKGASTVLFSKAEEITASFYGYNTTERKGSWSSDFDSARTHQLPEIIKINFKDRETGEKRNIILRTNVNSSIKAFYNEIYSE